MMYVGTKHDDDDQTQVRRTHSESSISSVRVAMASTQLQMVNAGGLRRAWIMGEEGSLMSLSEI